jgi:hypothetical protein
MENNLIFYQLLPPHQPQPHQLEKLLHHQLEDDQLSNQLLELYDDIEEILELMLEISHILQLCRIGFMFISFIIGVIIFISLVSNQKTTA